MRVLQLLSSTGVHGAETMAIELACQLHALGVPPYVGLLETPGSASAQIRQRLADHVSESIVVPCRHQLDSRSIHFLRRYLRDQNIDVIHSHGYKPDFYALAAQIGTPMRLVSTCHNWLGHDLKMRLYAAIDKRILRRFDAVVGVSTDVTAELRRYIPGNKVSKIGNGIDPETFHHILTPEQAKKELGQAGKKLVGFIGRLTHDKGVGDLLNATAALRAKHENLHLLVVGDGEDRTVFEHETRTLGLNEIVTFTGTRTDTPLIYSALDIFVLPSYQEGFPMVVLEAMACGVPIVATTVGDIPEIIEHGMSGLLVAPGDVAALGGAIAHLLAHPAKAQEMGAAAKRRVREKFTSKAMAQAYLALYSAVLPGH